MERKDNITYNYCFEDNFLEENIDNRHLFLNEMVDENIINDVVYYILRYNFMDRDLAVEDRKPIILYINSPGGSVVDGYGLIDAIITSKTPVYTVNVAQCASMGFLIYIAGKKRFAFPHAEFLMHDGSTAGWDSTAKMKDRMDFETNQVEKVTKEYIMSHTKIDEATYNDKYRVEWYFFPQEGKDIGVVDYIVGEDCEIDEIL